MRKRTIYGFSLLAAIVLAFGLSTRASGEDFYKGKTLRFVVAFSAGGGFDTYTRAIARHMGRHIPGNPTTLVQNMTGAGGIIATNYMYNKAKPDGLTIGNWIGGLVQQQIFGAKGVQYDARKFEWVGVPSKDHAVCGMTVASGITSLDKWFASKTPVKVGGIGPGGQVSDIPRILNAALGVPVKVIDGYRGTAKVRLAAESGELAGGCWAWQSMKVTWKRMVESGGVKVIVQAMPEKHPELPDVPNASDYAKTEEAHQYLKYGIHDTALMTRLYSLPPGTPKKGSGSFKRRLWTR
jgi:tripartite-type tricarboxylate transporter receptor subunit TctC